MFVNLYFYQYRTWFKYFVLKTALGKEIFSHHSQAQFVFIKSDKGWLLKVQSLSQVIKSISPPSPTHRPYTLFINFAISRYLRALRLKHIVHLSTIRLITDTYFKRKHSKGFLKYISFKINGSAFSRLFFTVFEIYMYQFVFIVVMCQ